jgi:hypothetical protein
MKEEFDKILVEKYPKIFKDRYGDPKSTLMCFGFGHGDGWFQILDSLCSNINHHVKWKRETRARDLLRYRAAKKGRDALIKWMSSNREIPPSDWIIQRCDEIIKNGIETLVITPKVNRVVAVQVKEKFGGLRFYYEGGDDQVHGMVRMAESWASVTCEVCGKPGQLRSGGWIKTLCDEHEEERQQGYKERFGDVQE